jgi:ketosteroid isomerase-like protein
MYDIDELLAANRAYYDALSARDIEAMSRVWTCTSEDINIAPPIRPVVHAGWDAVKTNYLTYWSTLSSLSVSMEESEVRFNGDTAWIHGVEVARRRLRDGGTEGSRNAGTSIFVRQDGRWRMTFHHTTALA